jgi:hypothetical protein
MKYINGSAPAAGISMMEAAAGRIVSQSGMVAVGAAGFDSLSDNVEVAPTA